MSGLDKWLPFFEQSSERRDVESWYHPIQAIATNFGLKIKQIVSDRASALLQLSKTEYLNVPSMPDLFHFNQILARKAGVIIGKKWKQTLKAYLEIKETKTYYSQRQPLEYQYLWQKNCRSCYQKSIGMLHRAIHPFTEKIEDEQVPWKSSVTIEKEIKQSIRSIDKQLIKSNSLKKKGKRHIEELYEVKQNLQHEGLQGETIEQLYRQIPDILKGVQHWQEWTKQRVENFLSQCYEAELFPQLSKQEIRIYLLQIILPMLYWQIILNRTPSKKGNKNLRIHYQKIIKQAIHKWQGHLITRQLTEEQQLVCQRWAERIVRSFQRASSQVEGRNGYLAFVHKAHRGLTKKRLNVLTVVHNFDIRGIDDKTPAERLFQKEFPDIFEFILNDVTSFSQPRRRKRKPLVPLGVRT
ncbi:MAG: DUF6399 domain-containing protein [Saprospiraceae bacterium]